MDLWKPLPPETNTVYVVKIPEPATGEPVEYTPDPGTRVRVYLARTRIEIGPAVAARIVYWSVGSGGHLVARVMDHEPLPARSNKDITLLNGYGQGNAIATTEIILPWDSGIYLVHGMVLSVWATGTVAGDRMRGMNLYVDVWHDMTVRTRENSWDR